MAKQCNHEDSRITCSACEKTICSNCLIQCPVGFRCKECVNAKSNSTQGKASPSPFTSMLKAFGASVLVGLVAGWLIPFMAIPYISCFICFFMGIYSGRWLVQHIDRSVGSKTTATVVIGVLFGMCLGPLNVIPLGMISILTGSVFSQGSSIFEGLNNIVSLVFDPVCFFAGVLRPIYWGVV